MKKLFLTITILTYAAVGYSEGNGSNLCNESREPGKTIECTSEMIADAVQGDACFGKKVGDEVEATVE